MPSPNAMSPSPQETKIPVESPDFTSHVENLEHIALKGIETSGGTESIQFRAGIEVEFALADPTKFREYIAEYHTSSKARLEKNLADPDNQRHAQIWIDEQAKTARNWEEWQLSQIKNPELIDIDRQPIDDLLVEFRDHAIGVVKRLPANNEAEESKRDKWLEQIPEFGTPELINFLLYEEFSNPSLADPTPPEDGSLDDIDQYSSQQGWLEFRFGNGTFQTGYYDNEGMCEIRLAPCAPSEAIRRKEIIEKRLVEIASQFGGLVQTDATHEHINLSVYNRDQGNGQFMPIIGQNTDRHAKTLDIAAGIAAAYTDGLWLNAKNMKWDYIFNPKGSSKDITFGPTRKSVRIMDGRLELRTSFHQADQALVWLMSGAISGLQKGHAAIENEGYSVPSEQTVYRVYRVEGFDKNTDLHIQRAFEKCEWVDDKFVLDEGFNWIRWEEIGSSLLGKVEDTKGLDAFNTFVFSCVELTPDGIPRVNAERMVELYNSSSEGRKLYLHKYIKDDFNMMATHLNEKLKVVRLEPTTVVGGTAKYKVDGVDAGLELIRNSSAARLAYGSDTDNIVSWLQNAIPEPQVA